MEKTTNGVPTGTKWDGNSMSQSDMMEKDTVIVLDEKDNAIGSASKKGSHIFNKDQPRGILHRAFSVFMFDKESGDLLLQQRASTKITFPNVWTNTCCSHPLHGMDPPEVDTVEDVKNGTVMGVKNAAIRKLYHELGIPASELPINEFKFLTRLHYWAADTITHGKKSPWGEHEIDYVLFILVDKNKLTVKPHPDEVDAVKWVSKEELIDGMKEGLWSPWFRLIANRWLVSDGGWWDDLTNTMTTDDQCDYVNIHRFDPPVEHMGGGGDAGPYLDMDNTKPITNRNLQYLQMYMSILVALFAALFSSVTILTNTPQFNHVWISKIPFQPTFHTSLGICILSMITSISFILSTKSKLLKAKMNMPFVPSNMPFFGSVKDFLVNVPWDLITGWHHEYGPIFSFTLLGRTCVAISSPTYLKTMLQSKIKNVKKDVQFAYKPFLPILGTGIVTSEGKSWIRQRLTTSAALRFDVLDDIPRITLKAVQHLCEKLDLAAETGESVELGAELRHLTLQVISNTFFSLSGEESNNTFAQMYLPIVDEANKRVWHPERSFCFFLPFFWKHLYNCKRLDSYVSHLIETRWELRKQENETKRNQDILDRMLSKYEKDPNIEWNVQFVKQLRDEMKTFMLAGHETSAAMMTWAIYELLKNEDLESKVTAEGISVFGNKIDWCSKNVHAPTRDELSNLTLCEGCLKEALRKYSVVPTVSRTVIKDTKVGPHIVPKGTTLFISIQGVHLDPNIWPNPTTFDPMRFCEPSPTPEPYTFMPFIDGPRNCLGQHLALLESKMVLGLLMQRYKFSLKDPMNGNPKHQYMVPVIPKAGYDDVYVSKRF